MKKFLILFSLSVFSVQISHAQSTTFDGSEIGVDLAFSASTFGGNVGIGAKYGLNVGEYFIFGPSVRYERIWWKNSQYGGLVTSKGGYNVYGGGAFAHARFFNALFIGAEFEMLKSPFTKNSDKLFNGFIDPTGKGSWAPTLLVGGGFSMEFQEAVRINAGVMYDVINAGNSPFRRSYKQTTSSTGQVRYLPIIYRIAFFFPIS